MVVCPLKAQLGGLWLEGSRGEAKVLGREQRCGGGGAAAQTASDLLRVSAFPVRAEEPLRGSEERGHDLP